MEHKIMIAKNLREGLEKIKEMCRIAFLENPLSEQWLYLERKNAIDSDMHEHKALVENNFAYDSRKLLRRIQGD